MTRSAVLRIAILLPALVSGSNRVHATDRTFGPPEPEGPWPVFMHHSYVRDGAGGMVAIDEDYAADINNAMGGRYGSVDILMNQCFSGGFSNDVQVIVGWPHTFASSSAWHQVSWTHDAPIPRRVNNFTRAWYYSAGYFPGDGFLAHFDTALFGHIAPPPPGIAKDPFAVPTLVVRAEEWPHYASTGLVDDARKLSDVLDENEQVVNRQFAILVAWSKPNERHAINIARIYDILRNTYGVAAGNIAVLYDAPMAPPILGPWGPVQPDTWPLPAVPVSGPNTRDAWLQALAGVFFANVPDGDDKLFIYNTGHGGHLGRTPLGDITLGPFGEGVIQTAALPTRLETKKPPEDDSDLESSIADDGMITVILGLTQSLPPAAAILINQQEFGTASQYEVAASEVPDVGPFVPEATVFYRVPVEQTLLDQGVPHAEIAIQGVQPPADPSILAVTTFVGGDQEYVAITATAGLPPGTVDGACCMIDGTCTVTNEADCAAQGATFGGVGSWCAADDWPVEYFSDSFDGPCLEWNLALNNQAMAFDSAFQGGAYVVSDIDPVAEPTVLPFLQIWRDIVHPGGYTAEAVVSWDQTAYAGDPLDVRQRMTLHLLGPPGFATVLIDGNSASAPPRPRISLNGSLVDGPANLPLAGQATLRFEVQPLSGDLVRYTGRVIMEGEVILEYTEIQSWQANSVRLRTSGSTDPNAPFTPIRWENFSLAPEQLCLGDLNGNGRRDGGDVQRFLECMFGSASECLGADIDGNGTLDSNDTSQFVVLLLADTVCP